LTKNVDREYPNFDSETNCTKKKTIKNLVYNGMQRKWRYVVVFTWI